MKKMIVLTCSILLALAGCAAVDRLLTPRAPGADSPLVEDARSVASTGLLGPWGQVALIAATGVQNLYLAGRGAHRAVRRRRESRASSSSSPAAPSAA